MDYKEALKLVQLKKPKENFMVIKFDYGKRLVLPYKDGLTLMAALNNAERFTSDYGKSTRIEPMERDLIESTVMSAEEYERIKIAALLQITPEEVKDHALQAA